MRSDAELLQAWRQGDAKSGEALFDRCFEPLVRFFRTKVSRGVDDLVQETLLACCASTDRIREDASFRAYLFGVARNVLSNHYRKQRRDGEAFDLGSHTAQELGPGPHTMLLEKVEHRLLLEGLRRIPLRDQIVLELYFWERLSAAAIGTVMDTPEPTIRTWIRRAKDRLQGELDGLLRERDLAPTQTDLEDWAEAVRRELKSGR